MNPFTNIVNINSTTVDLYCWNESFSVIHSRINPDACTVRIDGYQFEVTGLDRPNLRMTLKGTTEGIDWLMQIIGKHRFFVGMGK